MRKSIRVGQRLFYWDGMPGYVALNSTGKRIFGPGETFQVDWLDAEGNIEDSHYLTLEDFAEEGITFGRGVMPWAK
jgi:hypothetical protein